VNQWRSRPKTLLAAGLSLVTLALYLPSLKNEFIAYDDQQYVTENRHVQQGLNGPAVVWAFKSSYATNWHPLTWLSHMLDCQIYGLHPAGHHLTNTLLHAANAVLLFLLLCRLTGAQWRSFAVAALFAWHPLHVESVAWIAERKDVLSGFFWMLTMLAYARYAESKVMPEQRSNRREEALIASSPMQQAGIDQSLLTSAATKSRRPWLWYGLALLFFALGLMSKPMVVTLPFVLLLLDFWPLKRFASLKDQNRGAASLFIEKLPFLILSAASCALTLWAQQQAMASTAGLRISERIVHAILAYGHYLIAMFVPRHLAVYYPYDRSTAAMEVMLAGALLVFITLLVLRLIRKLPYLATGWFWFLGTLVPVLGLVQVGEQAWADRYTYLPSIGLFIMMAWAIADLAGQSKPVRTALPWLGTAVAIVCVTVTSVQLSHWRNTRTLFEHVAGVTRKNPLSATLLGSLLAQEGKYDQAIAYYREALSYSPAFPEAHFYLGHAYDQQGKLDEAIAEYEQAVWFNPISEQTHIRLGVALAKQHKLEQAAAQHEAALKLDPESAVAHNNFAKLLHAQGRLDEAIAHYSAALKYDPSLAQAHNNLGVLLLQKGRAAEGVAQLREALRLKPNDVETQINLAQALVEQQKWNEAADLFAKTVSGATSDANIHCRYASALAHLGRTREAMREFASALLLQQDLPDALDGLSWILATDPHPEFRNGTEAVRMAEGACRLTGETNAAKLKTLAAAYAEAGRFQEAAATADHAHQLAAKSGQQDSADLYRHLADSFKSSMPWRQAGQADTNKP
jgi:tetratricopeptide (TPR) repeat protein